MGQGLRAACLLRLRFRRGYPRFAAPSKDAFLASWNEVEASKDAIARYCLNRDGDLIGDSITNIFKYVIPTDIFVLRNTDVHEVALMCNYRYDPEHGLAAVFENERLKKIIPQDEL